MQFEWNADKAEATIKKREVKFEEAETVFLDPLYVDFYDDPHAVEEHRFLIIGESDTGRLLMVSYAERFDTIRIISARDVTAQERKDYEQRGFNR
jgi:uncharacterized DUF497 family protein